MCEDCGLLRLLCALNPIPYLTEHVQPAGLRPVSDLRQVLGIRHSVSDLRVEVLISTAQTKFIQHSSVHSALAWLS